MNSKSAEVADLVQKVVNLSFMELVELSSSLADILREKGIEPFPTSVAVSAGAHPAGAEDAGKGAEQAKSLFDVVFTEVDLTKKIAIIKEVRSFTDLGLKDAKDLVESGSGAVIKAGVDAATAQEMKTKLEAVGAKVELR